MILDSPGVSPSVIAHAHGFSAAEVAELLPIFLDNLRADFSSGGGPASGLTPPAPQPGETPEEHADRYLSELAQNGHLDVVGYDTLGVVDGGLDDGAELDGADLGGALDEHVTHVDASPTGDVELDDVAPDLPDQHLDDLDADDPFAAPAAETDSPGPFEQDVPFDGVDDPGEPFDLS